MGQKHSNKDSVKKDSANNRKSCLFGLSRHHPFLDQVERLEEDDALKKIADLPPGSVGIVWLSDRESDADSASTLAQFLINQLPSWGRTTDKRWPVRFDCTTSFGWLWRLSTRLPAGSEVDLQHDGLFALTPYSHTRDQIGAILAQAEEKQLEHLLVFADSGAEQLGALVGLEMSLYRFQRVFEAEKFPNSLKLALVSFDRDVMTKAGWLGWSSNIARHLVNLPASTLSPDSYCDVVEQLFEDSKYTKVQILRQKQLKEEGLELIQAVGRGAKEEPAIVHISYRPSKDSKQMPPMVFVGKGITFDTGGLDIKPSSGMRFMKKDMGGSASVVGIAAYADRMQIAMPCDFYLAIAENAVSAKAFKPGDVLKTANGMSVEIHNTDAEGRLVLADALIYAQKQEPKPSALIDIATLTGAMRVAVGTKLAGLFANHDKLAQSILSFGQKFGDPCWRMPLYDDYWTQMRSPVADFSNASSSSYGGGITAALFLKKFVTPEVKWAHLDLYAWTDQASGCLLETGGNGHAVQLFAQWLEHS